MTARVREACELLPVTVIELLALYRQRTVVDPERHRRPFRLVLIAHAPKVLLGLNDLFEIAIAEWTSHPFSPSY